MSKNSSSVGDRYEMKQKNACVLAQAFLLFNICVLAQVWVSLTRVELVSLKNVFFASSDKCVLVVCVYNCAHLRQNLLKNSAFKVLRSFYAQKINKTRKPSAIIRPYNQGD